MANLLSATWSVSVTTDGGVIRRSGTDMESLADFIDDLCDKGLIDFDTSVEGDEDDDDGEDELTDLDDEHDEEPDPPAPGSPSPDSTD